MADKADQALKLAQKVEKDLARIEKNLIDQINKALKQLTELHNEQDKRFTELHNEQNKRLNEMDKKYTDAHNQQAKEIAGVVTWAKQTFDTKGWF